MAFLLGWFETKQEVKNFHKLPLDVCPELTPELLEEDSKAGILVSPRVKCKSRGAEPSSLAHYAYSTNHSEPPR
jgi:hypothetical protein